MATVEILRSFAVAVYPGSTAVLNLSTGSFFQVDSEATPILMAIARGAAAAALEQQMAELCKIPRYAARERVRALQLQLASPYALASSQGSFVRTLGAVHIGEHHGILRIGEAPTLRGATLRSKDGVYFVGGPKDSGKSLLCAALERRGFQLLAEGAMPLRIRNGKIDLALAHAWFLESKRSSGMGLMLAACSAGYVINQLLTHTSSSHSRGAWVEIFRLYAALAEDLPAFRVTLPEGALAVQQAVSGFTQALGMRAHEGSASRSTW